MLFTAHALSGSAIGGLVSNAYIALPAGVLMHFALDAIPHYDTTDGGKFTQRQIILIGSDLCIGLTVFSFIGIKYNLNFDSVIAGIVGGVLPDIISQAPPIKSWVEKYKIGRRYQKFHTNIQKKKISPGPGILIQIVIWIVSIVILIITAK